MQKKGNQEVTLLVEVKAELKVQKQLFLINNVSAHESPKSSSRYSTLSLQSRLSLRVIISVQHHRQQAWRWQAQEGERRSAIQMTQSYSVIDFSVCNFL